MCADMKNLLTKQSLPIVNYYLLQNDSITEQFGGTGIFLISRLNYLKALGDRIDLHTLPIRPAHQQGTAFINTLMAIITYGLREIWLLVTASKGIHYLVYPKIPLVAYGVSIWTWPFAIVGYSLFWIRKQITGIKIIVEIEDLPIERKYLGKISATTPDLSLCNWRYLTLWERAYTLLEWIIFHSADQILQPSPQFSEHVVRKFGISADCMALYRREIYMPTYEGKPTIGVLPDQRKINLFYSGNLTLDFLVPNLKQIMDAIIDLPQVALYICGSEGEWVVKRCQARNQENVHHLGLLSHVDHDAAARQCDIGLMLYGHSYADFKCTAKYPAYVANGLAVLSTDLLYLRQIISEDGTGLAVPIDQITTVLRHWINNPETIQSYRNYAKQIARYYTNGSYMGEWFEPIIASRFSQETAAHVSAMDAE